MRTNRVFLLLAVGFALIAREVRGERLDDVSAKALAETLRSLQSSDARALDQVDPRLASIRTSPELAREFHELAAAVLTELTERYGGDPARMEDALARAKEDPAAFAATLSPATRARLATLATKFPAR